MAEWYEAPQPLLPEYVRLHGRWLRDEPAIIDGERTLSWGELDARCSQVAHALLGAGLQPGERVLVVMTNGAAMLEVFIGTLRAGLVVVPINLSIPDAAIAAMAQDSAARAVIATPDQALRLFALGASLGIPPERRFATAPGVEGFGDFVELCARQSASPPDVRVDGDAECNIIYSSGTTGLPKGIVHTHRRRLDWAYDLALALRYHGGAVTLCSLGLYSNISWAGFLATFLTGGTVVVMRSFDAGEALRLIERHRVTHGAFVPLQFRRMLDDPAFACTDLSSLRTLMCCGSPLGAVLKREAVRRLRCELIELYGLTEGLITTLAPEDLERKTESVGKPLPGTDIRILGEDDREMPVGQAGEIVGYGRIVMAGYLNRAEANAEATWTDPEGRRWLRTGDIGRLDEEGFLYLVDRKKDMILSGGQNVYPADIEAVMQGHPDVAEVAVIGVPSEKWGETPLACVVPRAGATLDPAELEHWTNERVGRQQRISGVVLRDSLPRNPNGKILKRELRGEYLAGAPQA